MVEGKQWNSSNVTHDSFEGATSAALLAAVIAAIEYLPQAEATREAQSQ